MLSRVPIILIAAIAFAALALAPGSPAGSTGTLTAFVAAEDDNAVVAVNLVTGKTIAKIRVPKPHNIAASTDGRFVLVASPAASRVTLISAATRRVLQTFTFGTPYDVGVSVDGRYGYVTDKQTDKLAVLDLRSRRVVGQVAVGQDPQALSVGDKIWITHGRHGAPALTSVDVSNPASPQVAGSLPTGGAAHDVTVQPHSPNVWVTYWGDTRLIGALDSSVGRILYQRHAGKSIEHLAYDTVAGNRLWVTDHDGNRVLLLNAKNGSMIRSIACSRARDLALATGRVAVTCHDRLLVMTPSFKKVRMLRAGRGQHGVALVVPRR